MMPWRSWSLASLAAAWRPGWPSLWRDRWRWLARRWAFALAGFGAGLLGVVGWQFEDWEALWDSEAQMEELQAKLHAQERPAQVKSEHEPAAMDSPIGPPPVLAWWPVQGTQASVWPQLERLLVQHGLRLLSLRLEPPRAVGTWPSQAVALRLQGRFDDWVAVWTALNTRGPLWSLERLRITPQDEGVAIDAVLRLWLSPVASATPKPTETTDPAELLPGSARLALRAGTGERVFVSSTLAPAASLGEAAGLKSKIPLPVPVDAELRSSALTLQSRVPALPMATLSPDPATWPLEQVRVAGVWQQAQGVQLILMAGPHWVSARVGQRIGSQGHVVDSIHAQEVHLRVAQGPVWVIGLEKAQP
ncbi:hypothetical protein [Limnohabitans sp. Bal53]|uniref:hypothetical protein n=1 Tax=Limnohabitans sp. Bal53 TaxID=1977910 RepID=UPI0011B27B80|nr:hypothetical protein [Limnohabitans sp. Bal53]